MTVGELIDYLRQFEPSLRVVLTEEKALDLVPEGEDESVEYLAMESIPLSD